jgi:hypothetical protein
MVFSRRRIRSSEFERYHFRGDPERLAQGEFLGGKGFQTVTIEGEGDRPLTLFNTHLHARYRRSRPRLNSAVRTAQLLQLVGALHRIDGPLVVGGDLNCTTEDPEYRVFTGLGGVREVGEGGPLHPTLSKANFYKRHRSGPDKRIDFLFVRMDAGGSWEARETRLLFAEPVHIRSRDRSYSDHYGFRSTLRLESREAWLAARGRHGPDPQTFDLARNLLEVGRREADRRERVHLGYAGAWAAAAALAAGLRRAPPVDRRSFLRGSANLLALASLGPAFGYTTLARLDSEHKRDAFDDARAVLARLESRAKETA